MSQLMTARERLLATLAGKSVDRPAVSFYEIGGLPMNPLDPDPFNVYNDPSWLPLLDLAETQTDLIRMRSAVRSHSHEAWDTAAGAAASAARRELLRTETQLEHGNRVTRTTIRIAGRTLTTVARREADVDTLWCAEPLLKTAEDLEAYLQLPDEFFFEPVDVQPLRAEETRLKQRGIVMVDTEDPLCSAATLFSMEDYTVVAFTQPKQFHRLLEKLSRAIFARTEQVAREFPGRLWRIYGPEFASEPYLPPRLFDEYVVRYTGPMVKVIQQHGGYVRLHCHGRILHILDSIVGMGVDAIDPIEPPPQGDVELAFVRQHYGDQLVLFGNIEVGDIERLTPHEFDQRVCATLRAGTADHGRGFVLMPSASPFGRVVSQRTLTNYRTMIQRVREYGNGAPVGDMG